jgi:thiol-disulfide isomerase/thioredoxin
LKKKLLLAFVGLGAALGFSLLPPNRALAAPDKPALSPQGEKLEEVRILFQQEKYKEGVKLLKEAAKLGEGPCVECELGMANAFNKMTAHREALKHVDEVLKSTTEKTLLSRAYNEQGVAFLALSGGEPERLAQAEKAFRKVLELGAGNVNPTRFNLGYTLLKQGRDTEGVALLKEYLQNDPAAISAEEAKEFIANPLRARKRFAHDFELVTLAGGYMTSEELRGKVVLLDFWGTWCPPCRAAIPDLRIMSRRMEKDPFVMISVSNDSDQEVLRKFVAENKMTWPQVWDGKNEMVRRWKIDSFPSYLLISHEGEILYTTRGWGPGIERDLNLRILEALRDAKRAQKRG